MLSRVFKMVKCDCFKRIVNNDEDMHEVFYNCKCTRYCKFCNDNNRWIRHGDRLKENADYLKLRGIDRNPIILRTNRIPKLYNDEAEKTIPLSSLHEFLLIGRAKDNK